MTKAVTYNRFVHLDTIIVSVIAKDKALWRPLEDFLFDNDLCLAIGEGQVIELNSDDRLHVPFVELITTVPSAFIKTHDVILAEEVESYPKCRTAGLLQSPITPFTDKAAIIQFLSSPRLAQLRADQRSASQTWAKLIEDLKSNSPPKDGVKYTRDEAHFFAKVLTLQQLKGDHDDFLQQFKGNANAIKYDVFLSAQISSYVVFYKYYLAGDQ